MVLLCLLWEVNPQQNCEAKPERRQHCAPRSPFTAILQASSEWQA